MKHIRLFEDTLESIKKEQLAKMALLKFTSKIIEIFKMDYRTPLKLVEQKETHHSIIMSYMLKYGTLNILSISINNTLDISIFLHDHLWKDFYDFLVHFLNKEPANIKLDYLYNHISLNKDELNNFSDEIMEEWELYSNIKKYNI